MCGGRVGGAVGGQCDATGPARGRLRSFSDQRGAGMTAIDSNWLSRLALRHGFLLVILGVYVFFSIAAPTFFGLGNLVDIFHITAPMMVVASGMPLIVISGTLD